MTSGDEELEAALREHFRTDGRLSEAAIETAFVMFDLGSIDDELASLSESLAPTRGPDGSTLRFESDGGVILVSVSPGSAAFVFAPAPDVAIVESAAGSLAVELDESGGANVKIQGVIRVRSRVEGRPDVVTEPIRIPRIL